MKKTFDTPVNTCPFFEVGDGLTMRREWGKSPNGNPFNGVWVLRKKDTEEYVDHDTYSNDLAERHDFKL